MSGFKLWKTSKQHIMQIGAMMIITLLIMTAFLTVLGICTAVFDMEDGEVNGIDSVFSVAALVASVFGCRQWFRSSLANGVSRKTEFLSVVFTAVATGLMCIVLDFALNGIASLIMGGHCISGYEIIASSCSWGMESALFPRIIVSFLSGVGSMIEGYCIGFLFYRLNHVGRIILICGVVSLGFVLSFLMDSRFWSALMERFASLIDWISNSFPGYLTANSVEILFVMVLAFLLLRRAPVK